MVLDLRMPPRRLTDDGENPTVKQAANRVGFSDSGVPARLYTL